MINAGQMENIPLSSDSESGTESRSKPRTITSTEDSFNTAAQIISLGERPSVAAVKTDGKSSLGPTPDLIPRTDDAGSRNRSLCIGRGSNAISDRSDTSTDIHGPDDNEDEADEEKQRLIAQVLELQHTLEDLSSRVDSVKEENLKLRSENQILGQYIENLMAASSVFQSSTPRMRRKASSGQNSANKSAAVKLQHP